MDLHNLEQRQSFQTGSETAISEINEDNNNFHQMDVVELLNLKMTDNEEQHSNSSSLESRDSLVNHQGSQDGDVEEESGSTSCSEDSFEMSSTCSTREEVYDEEKKALRYNEQNEAFQKIRTSVANQIKQLDTGLPNLDFDKLEKQLATAAKQREDIERRMNSDNIPDPKADCWKKFSSFSKNNKNNAALRLPTSKNLQVCFMNELSETDTENGEDSDDSDVEHVVRKSKSVPNFKQATSSEVLNSKSMQELYEKLDNNLRIDDNERCKILRNEANRVSKIAEERANNVLVEYRRGRSKASEVPRQARQYLSKTKLRDIQLIHQQIEEAINRKNTELVGLLLERDNLHMEHDSLRVDIDDYTQQKSPLIFLDMKRLLQLQKGLQEKEKEKKFQ